MRIFILKFDNTVDVTDTINITSYFVHRNYPKGQIFREKLTGTTGYVWTVLHRDYKGNGPAWDYTANVPEQVRFARMLTD